jgi:molybdopterin molybdotransferase
MLPLQDALRIVDDTLSGHALPSERVPVRAAVGRTLAADAVSRLDLPPFDKSAMDGYAVAAGDERESYRVLETVGAGSMPAAKLEPGTTVKVMTGAPVPEATGRVIKVEDVERQEDRILVRRREGDTNICALGEDVRCGDRILSAARRVSVLDAANLIGCGITEVQVRRRVRVAIFATGDEIVAHPDDLRPGKIMDSNGPLMTGLAVQFGLQVVRAEHLGDSAAATISALRAAMAEADLTVFSGGVSVGDFDFVGQVLEQVGLRVLFDSVAVKPGRPTTFAVGQVANVGQIANLPGGGGDSGKKRQVGNLPHAPHAVFGLPGNPVSVYMGFHVFVLRAAARMMQSEPLVREFTLPLGFDFRRRKVNRTEYVPGRLGEDGSLQPVEFHGSAHLTALSQADGFFIVPAGVQTISAGEVVQFAAIGL